MYGLLIIKQKQKVINNSPFVLLCNKKPLHLFVWASYYEAKTKGEKQQTNKQMYSFLLQKVRNSKQTCKASLL